MSRLGDLILLERTRQKLSPKQVARKCGISEKYLLEVESGKRIIQDDQARRILRTIGLREQTEADFSLDEIAATVDLEMIKTQPEKAREVHAPSPAPAAVKVASSQPGESASAASGIWLDALGGVLKAVPVMNAAWQNVARRLLPIQNGRIEGANPDKVLYFLAPDDSMRGFRVLAGDFVLIVPAQSPVDEAIMLVEYKNHRALRKVKKLDATRVLLQSYGREYGADTLDAADVNFIGRAVRLEANL